MTNVIRVNPSKDQKTKYKSYFSSSDEYLFSDQVFPCYLVKKKKKADKAILFIPNNTLTKEIEDQVELVKLEWPSLSVIEIVLSSLL